MHSWPVSCCTYLANNLHTFLRRPVFYILYLYRPDAPSAPGTPEVVDFDKDCAEIKWTPPKKDGGSRIKRYLIESKPKNGDWQKVCTLCQELHLDEQFSCQGRCHMLLRFSFSIALICDYDVSVHSRL